MQVAEYLALKRASLPPFTDTSRLAAYGATNCSVRPLVLQPDSVMTPDTSPFDLSSRTGGETKCEVGLAPVSRMIADLISSRFDELRYTVIYRRRGACHADGDGDGG